ncbi:MAG: hypothetical protein ACRD0P_00210 [Stackebrandtia sp.]
MPRELEHSGIEIRFLGQDRGLHTGPIDGHDDRQREQRENRHRPAPDQAAQRRGNGVTGGLGTER